MGFTNHDTGNVLRHAAIVAALTMLGVAGSAGAAQTADAADQPAVWTTRNFTFEYQGFTTRYTCDGLREKMRSLLIKLGARDDLQVTPYGCPGRTGPDLPIGIIVKMRVLAPAPAGTAQSVSATWKKVDLLGTRAPLDAASDCELIAQVQRKVLPQFATRNVDYRADCRRGQVVIGSTIAQADVLTAAGGPPGTTAAR